MKKIQNFVSGKIALILGWIAILSPLTSSAQGSIEFGANASLDFTMLTGVGPAHPSAGFAVQGMSSLALAKRFSLQASLGYAYRSYFLEMNEIILPPDISPTQGIVSSSSLIYKGSYHEIQLPVLFKFHLKSTNSGPYLGAGPMVGVAGGHSGRGVLHQGNGVTEDLVDVSYRAEPRLALQACIGQRMALGSANSLSVELYGNAYAGEFFLAPARNFSAGLRVGLWL